MEREKFFMDRLSVMLNDPEQVKHRENVFCVDGPAFVPLEDLVTGLCDVALENEQKVLLLTNYSTPSHRLPRATNIHDLLSEIHVPRQVHYKPKNTRIPLFNEEKHKWYVMPSFAPLFLFLIKCVCTVS